MGNLFTDGLSKRAELCAILKAKLKHRFSMLAIVVIE